MVAKNSNTPAGAVLIRAIEPIEGIKQMQKFREIDDIHNLTSGPGKLTKALNITKKQNGVDVTKKGEMYLLNGKKIDESSILASPRIGIRMALDKQWRFFIADNKFVSRKVNTNL
jgi:DNA-3-methyladenine glycosylase